MKALYSRFQSNYKHQKVLRTSTSMTTNVISTRKDIYGIVLICHIRHYSKSNGSFLWIRVLGGSGACKSKFQHLRSAQHISRFRSPVIGGARPKQNSFIRRFAGRSIEHRPHLEVLVRNHAEINNLGYCSIALDDLHYPRCTT